MGGWDSQARSLDADPVASRFSAYLCSQTGSDLLELVRSVRTGTSGPAFCLSVLQECLTQEKPEIQSTYLMLENMLSLLGTCRAQPEYACVPWAQRLCLIVSVKAGK